MSCDVEGLCDRVSVAVQRPGPWYRNGLRFECVRCQNCCRNWDWYVAVTDTEIKSMGEYLHTTSERVQAEALVPEGEGIWRLRAEGPDRRCAFYDGHGCTIHAVKPRQCWAFPFYDSQLQSPETWLRCALECPGIGRGPQLSLAEIEARRLASRLEVRGVVFTT